jgi:hypothetical protein
MIEEYTENLEDVEIAYAEWQKEQVDQRVDEYMR